MKKLTLIFLLMFIFSFTAGAQETESLLDKDFDSLFGGSSPQPAKAPSVSEIDSMMDVDFDSLFDGSFTSAGTETKTPAKAPVNVIRKGITFGASYEFQGTFAPGWSLAPWHWDGTEERTWGQGVKMASNFSINAQLSEVFKVYTAINFNIPGFAFELGDFFFDYNFFNRVFLRAGKYEHTWGHSDFTNLLSRVPDVGPFGPSYVAKVDVPIGIGGFQALALTRVDIAGNKIPEHMNELGLGAKYNVALRWLDLDMGVFFQRYVMPTRGFLSLKTTLWKTEIYNEWLVAVNTHTDNAASFAANLGLGRDFFDEKLTLGGEVFYNGEGNTFFYKPETNFTAAEDKVDVLDQFQISFNFLYRLDCRGSPKIFTSVKFLTAENSYQVIPGFKFTPTNDVEVYFAVPMALGDKEGYYYRHNEDVLNRPFSITMLITLKGSVYASSFN